MRSLRRLNKTRFNPKESEMKVEIDLDELLAAAVVHMESEPIFVV